MQEVCVEKGCSMGRNDLRLQCSHEHYFREIAMFRPQKLCEEKMSLFQGDSYMS